MQMQIIILISFRGLVLVLLVLFLFHRCTSFIRVYVNEQIMNLFFFLISSISANRAGEEMPPRTTNKCPRTVISAYYSSPRLRPERYYTKMYVTYRKMQFSDTNTFMNGICLFAWVDRDVIEHFSVAQKTVVFVHCGSEHFLPQLKISGTYSTFVIVNSR